MRFKKTSMPVPITTFLTILTFGEVFLCHTSGVAQEPLPLPKAIATSGTKPGFNFRPIGSPSQVDRFQQPVQAVGSAASLNSPSDPYGSGVQQTAFRQGGGFSVPPNGFAAPVASPEAPPVNATTPPSLGTSPITRGQTGTPLPLSNNGLRSPTGSPSDLQEVPRPTMNQQQWSTTSNDPLVTGPSGYPTAGFNNCYPGMTYTQTTGPIAMLPPGSQPYAVVPPTIPPNSPQALAVYPTSQASVGPSPLISLGQERYNVQLGQGIIGQPVAYVPGQYFRNFLRYLAP